VHADRSRWNTALVVATVLAAAACLSATLLVAPVVGLADNGDLSRVLVPAGLAHESESFQDRYFAWMQPRFTRVEPARDISGYRTSELYLTRVAVAGSRVFSPGPSFDVRFLAVVHMLLLLAALALLVTACREIPLAAQAVASVLLVFVFTDVGYAATLTTPYSQTASLLFLLLAAGVAALAIRRGRLEGMWLPAYFLCVAAFVCSKPQESVQAPLLLLFGIRLAWPGSPARSRAAALALAAAVAALAWRYYRSAEIAIGPLTEFHLIFKEILPHSPDPAADLETLGLPRDWVRYTGALAWGPGSPFPDPEFRAHFGPRSGHPSPRLFFFKHPRRFLEHLGRAAQSSTILRPEDLGNYSRESGARPQEQARRFSAWSAWRARLTGAFWPAALLAANLVFAIATWRRSSLRGRLAREGLVLLLAMAAGAFVICALGDSGAEMVRHLFIFHALCDLVLIADAVWLADGLARFAASRRAVLFSAPSRVGL
jgi:hypothetical protein